MFAARIVSRRKAADITQKDLAARSGVPQGRLSDYENGHRPILLEDALDIVAALNCTIGDLTTGGRLF